MRDHEHGTRRAPAAAGSSVAARATPEVTVIIPTRDRVHLLPVALTSALAQEDVDLEVIVVDDASQDETPQLLAGVGDERLRVLSLDARHGVARARNVGIAQARGAWLAFLDDDDIWAPRKLRWQLDAAEMSEDAFVYGAAVTIDQNHAIVRYGRPPTPSELPTQLLVANVIPGGCSNVIARAGLVRGAGGFDERLSHLADRDLWIRLAHAGRPFACDSIVVAYRRHLGNMRYRPEPDGVEELEYLIEKYGPLRRQYGISARRRGGYRYFARAQRSAGHRLQAASTFARLGLKERLPADLARAVAALFGHGDSSRRNSSTPRAAAMPLSEIEWLRSRSPEEIRWLRALTLECLDGAGPPVMAPSHARV